MPSPIGIALPLRSPPELSPAGRVSLDRCRSPWAVAIGIAAARPPCRHSSQAGFGRSGGSMGERSVGSLDRPSAAPGLTSSEGSLWTVVFRAN
ncbi:MAG: hypothetical protein VKO39_09150 [Cyanobacteriota bacterium]|nr:hypothetical protein [Cyanobacteriota bacterium]